MLALLLWLSTATAIAAPPPLHVLIDPGHGGKDNGTTRSATRESEITLAVSLRLYELLRRDRSFKVTLTRSEDRHLNLAQRARLAREAKPDVFLSIHVNSNPDARAKGAEFYFQNQLPPDEESMFLAHRENDMGDSEKETRTYAFVAKNKYPAEVSSIVSDLLDSDRILRSSELSRALKTNWRSRQNKSNTIRQAPFFVLSQLHTPSALVELGFLTNNEDFAQLTQNSVHAKMAEDLYRGLLQYRESITNTGHALR
ncbi:MAG: N-acetylmuramoyl-L-alanine amidase [Bdellovibrionales bacterium]|nr:N-acetylmuramoyl-L-alanine amidase [Bdellovibrionales bacterium]